MWSRQRWLWWPEVSLSAQRRTINSVTVLLLVVVLVISMLVGTRRVTMHTPDHVGLVHRAFAAVSPVIDGYAAPVEIEGDRGESPRSPGIAHRLSHWINSAAHDGPWLVMMPSDVSLNRSEMKKTVEISGMRGPHSVRALSSYNTSDPVDRQLVRALIDSGTTEWREARLQEINDALTARSWGTYQLLDYREAAHYLHLMKCDYLVVLSVHPFHASFAEQEFVRHAFEWDMSSADHCVMNIFPYERRNPTITRYDALLRAMHLLTSNTISTSTEATFPWLMSVGHSTTFTGRNTSFGSLIQDLSKLAPTLDHPSEEQQLEQQPEAQEQAIEVQYEELENHGWFNGLWKWLKTAADSDTHVEAADPISASNLPWHEEDGYDTIEALMCQNKTDQVNLRAGLPGTSQSLSCANVPAQTPSFYRMAYIAGTRSMCHYKLGPHVAADIQLFRPSPVAALIAGTMHHVMTTKENVANESSVLSKVLAVVGGLSGGDVSGVCRARMDGNAGRRRWYDACQHKRRFIAARTVEPRRFSGNSSPTTVFGFDSDSDESKVYVHETLHDTQEMRHYILESVRKEANHWLTPTSEGAFRFFGGQVPSADWILEGPDSIALTCGKWLAGSGCSSDLHASGVIHESAAWACGDMAVTFQECGEDQFYRQSFREQVLKNPTCDKELSWLRSFDGQQFSYDSFAQYMAPDGESVKRVIEKLEQALNSPN